MRGWLRWATKEYRSSRYREQSTQGRSKSEKRGIQTSPEKTWRILPDGRQVHCSAAPAGFTGACLLQCCTAELPGNLPVWARPAKPSLGSAETLPRGWVPRASRYKKRTGNQGPSSSSVPPAPSKTVPVARPQEDSPGKQWTDNWRSPPSLTPEPPYVPI